MYYPNLNSILFAVRRVQWRRVVSFMLAVLLFATSAPIPAFSVESGEQGSGGQSGSVSTPNSGELIYDYDTLHITQDGEDIATLDLLHHEKIELSADGVAEEAKYQWQVQHPEKDDLWVNVYDGTKQTISVTLALVENVLRENGTVKLRCRAYTEDYAYLSNSVTVTVLHEQAVTMPAMYAMPKVNRSAVVADAVDTPEFVTVTIEYIRYVYVLNPDGETFSEMEVGLAFTSYVATLKSGTDLIGRMVHCPTIVGFEPTLVRVTEGGVERDPKADEFEDVDDIVTINQQNVTSDVVYRVEYHPAQVDYEVRYFFQNIYDDLYVENASIVTNAGIVQYPVQAKGYTGQHPNKSHTEAIFEGFTSLYYEPETIAADGSTVFHVYYERNYYLMEFDCNGGYGTDTVYVRYGTHVSVPQPVKSGYIFAGWDLCYTDQDSVKYPWPALGEADTNGRYKGDGVKDGLPATLPPYNTAYKALWTEAEASYTMAYWIVDAYGNKTYIGSRSVNTKEENGVQVPIKSGDKVDGVHDLASKEAGGPAICGYEAHAHNDSCYICGLGAHKHTLACFDGMGYVSNNPENGLNIIKQLETPQSGYIYVVYSHEHGRYWPKLYLEDANGNGTYYTISSIEGGYDVSSFSSIIEGDSLGTATGTYNNEKLSVWKYSPKTTCNTTQHIHDNSCRTCEEHTHSDNCYQDASKLVVVDEVTLTDKEGKTVTIKTDKNVTVQGDGSTVVNVYYEYREYTLKFYYAASETVSGNTNFYVIGGSTYYFGQNNGTATTDDLTQLQNMFISHSSERGLTEVASITAFFNQTGTDRITDRVYTQGIESGNDGWSYHYISFTARYGDNISEKWPIDIFNPVEMASGNTNTIWGKSNAVASAWNGEYYVKYSQDKQNETIKGKYEKLDENLLLVDHDDEDSVSFLCFWENGAKLGNQWNIPKLFRYNIWIEASSSEIVDNGDGTFSHVDGKMLVKKKDGVIYKRIDVYNTCDDSGTDQQTQPALIGYTENGRDMTALAEVEEVTDQETQYDGDIYDYGENVNFYYTANRHSLKFYNYNGWLGSGAGAGNSGEGGGVSYGTPMSVFGNYVNAQYMKTHYPDVLEPGAYEFVGWYISPGCLDGTEVDWEKMTMPDADLTLYAKWAPINRDVYFYYDYEDYISALNANDDDKRDYYWYHTDGEGNKVPDSYPIRVQHGSLLGTVYSSTPEPREGYTFVGWFYIDETGKKRFAPDTMEVKKQLHLFAEWRSDIDTQYEVTYVLGESHGEYAAGTVIATPTKGHLTAGKTKTFTAKVGAELLPDFQKLSLFPTTNSHSILMEQEPEHNTYPFTYVIDEEVLYIVRYVDKITGVPLTEPVIKSSQNAIVTEKFLPFDGYLPENYYIRKVLASDGSGTKNPEDATEDDVSELNEIIFYYTPDDESGLFVVEYYTENIDGSWYLEQSELGSADLDTEIPPIAIEPNKFDGFHYSRATVTTYDEHGTDTEKIYGSGETAVTGVVSKNGLEIRIYYTRNKYPYTIQYVEYGTDNVLEEFQYTGDNALLFKATVTHKAPDSFAEGDTTYLFYPTAEKPQSQTLTIRASDTENVMIFYYRAKSVSIYYEAICLVPGAVDYGGVSYNYESAVTLGNIFGSEAIPGAGFRFVGWYSDKECSNLVANTELFRPNSMPAKDQVTFYALFEPIFSNLTIHKVVENLPIGMPNDDVFLFHIQGVGKTAYIDIIVSISGNGSVTLKDLPIGDYIVTELTNWSWEYDKTPTWSYTGGGTGSTAAASITVSTDGGTITFTNTYVEQDWLGGEGSKENVFTNP